MILMEEGRENNFLLVNGVDRYYTLTDVSSTFINVLFKYILHFILKSTNIYITIVLIRSPMEKEREE